jgi:hypothetical protein
METQETRVFTLQQVEPECQGLLRTMTRIGPLSVSDAPPQLRMWSLRWLLSPQQPPPPDPRSAVEIWECCNCGLSLGSRASLDDLRAVQGHFKSRGLHGVSLNSQYYLWR